MRLATIPPLDQALELLRGHALLYRPDEHDLRLWRAVCPCCEHPGWGLCIRELRYHGAISLTCSTRCSENEIKEALQAEPIHPRIEAAELRADRALQQAEAATAIAASALEQLVGAVQ
jgi:hypothetical protein